MNKVPNKTAVYKTPSYTRTSKIIWRFFDALCDHLSEFCPWISNNDSKSVVLYNLIQGKLTFKWIYSTHSLFVAYTDGHFKKDDVLWFKDDNDEFGVGRVLFIIEIDGFRNMQDLDGNELVFEYEMENPLVVVGSNTWIDEEDDDHFRGDLRKYWNSLPIFKEFHSPIQLWSLKNVICKVAYRHAHVMMPKHIWNLVWRKGSKDMRYRKGANFKKWSEWNRNVYLWALRLNDMTVSAYVPWCGIRKICDSHHNWDCLECQRKGNSARSVPRCVKDGRWVVIDITHGYNSKFAENVLRE